MSHNRFYLDNDILFYQFKKNKMARCYKKKFLLDMYFSKIHAE